MFIPGIDKWEKPNVRKMFLPDAGHIIFDIDLKQADAQTVAWEADDAPLKDFFKAAKTDDSLDLHTTNARDIYGPGATIDGHKRQMAKHGVHGTNFGASPARLAKTLDMTRHQADQFIKRWFQLHPAIKKWQRRVEDGLMRTRTVTNRFGYRRIFFGRLEHMLPEALAWVPQSTTVIIIDIGMGRVDERLPEAKLLLQVHDSAVGQYLKEDDTWIRPRLQELMTVEVPYDDPMTIPVELSISDISWGHCKEVSWHTHKKTYNAAQ